MSAYLLRRFGQGLLVLWAAFTLTFFLLQVLPGDAVLIKFQNPDLGLSPAQIAEMRLAYGADSPLWRQYLHTLLAMLHGDFGYSLQAGLAVSSLIASNLPDTLSLALPAFLLAVALAFALAFASRLPGLRWLSNFLQSLPVLFISRFLRGVYGALFNRRSGKRLHLPDDRRHLPPAHHRQRKTARRKR